MSLGFSVAMCMWALPIGIGILIVSLIVVDIRCTIQDKKFHRLSTMYYERFGVKKGNEFLERCKRLRSMDEVVEVLEKALGIQKKQFLGGRKMKVAFLVDDGVVLSGVYNRRRFVPDNKGCGFHYQVIAESDIGKILFFNEDLANMCVEEPHSEKRQYLIKLKTDEFHDDYSKVISARSRKDAIDKIADYLYQKNRVGVWNIYHILENYDTDNIEDFWKREKIIQCGSHGQYVRLIKAVEFVK